MAIREEIFKSAALGLLSSIMGSAKLTPEQLDEACGWNAGELESRLWHQEAFSMEDLCHLLLAAKSLAVEGCWTDEPPLARFDHVLFQAIGFRDGSRLTEGTEDDGQEPEEAWSGRLLGLMAKYVLLEVVDGRYSAKKLAAELHRYAELAEELEEKASEPVP